MTLVINIVDSPDGDKDYYLVREADGDEPQFLCIGNGTQEQAIDNIINTLKTLR